MEPLQVFIGDWNGINQGNRPILAGSIRKGDIEESDTVGLLLLLVFKFKVKSTMFERNKVCCGCYIAHLESLFCRMYRRDRHTVKQASTLWRSYHPQCWIAEPSLAAMTA